MIALDANADRVRVATQRDEDELMELCRRNHAENGLGAFSVDKVRTLMRRAFVPCHNEPAVIGVAGETCIEGSVCLIVDTPWDSDAPFLQAVWNYVLPEYRRTTNAKDLIAFARRLSQPAPVGTGLRLRMSISSNCGTESQVKLYKRQLGDPVGLAWMCGPDIVRAN